MALRRRHKLSRVAVWLALLAVLVQALLPAFHHPAGMALAGEVTPTASHNMCLAPGGAPPEPGKSPAHHMPPCPICQAVHAIGGFAPPTPPPVSAARFWRIIAVAESRSLVLRRWFGAGNQARAPPIPV